MSIHRRCWPKYSSLLTCWKKHEDDESDVDLRGGHGGVEALQQTWQPATGVCEVKGFEQLVDPKYNLPVDTKVLDCFC